MNFLCYTTKITCQGERRIYVNRRISCDKKRQNRILSLQYYAQRPSYQPRKLSSEVQAHQAYTAACELLSGTETIDEAFYRTNQLAFEKIVSLINFRDNHMYIPTPIYLRKNLFQLLSEYSPGVKI